MLTTLDWILLAVYLLGVVAVGVVSRGKQENADDYFTASGRMSSPLGTILVGLSIAATLFSGLSFLAYPSVVYASGMGILVGMVVFPIAWLTLKYWFLPRFLKAGVRRPYDVIEQQFGPGVRIIAAVMFILLRIGWMAALIYAPALAILAAGGLSEAWFWPLVLAIGLSSTIYTVLGGIRGVIVTDAIQFLVIAGGVAVTIGYVLVNLPIGLGEAWGRLAEADRLGSLDFSLSLTTPMTFWAVLFGFVIANLGAYMADQMSLQRYLAAGGVKAATRSFAINIVGVVIVLVLLAGVGLSLSAWYMAVPDPLLPRDLAGQVQADRVFPHFVATQMPMGVAGLLLAAILAATMSSMTSGINALAASVTLDLGRNWRLLRQGRAQVWFARGMSLLVGCTATAAAGLVAHMGSIFDIAQSLLGVFLGPLLACIVLSLTRWRAVPWTVALGLVGGCLAGWAVIVCGALAKGMAEPPAWIVAVGSLYVLWLAPLAAAVALVVPVVATGLLRGLRGDAALVASELRAPEAHASGRDWFWCRRKGMTTMTVAKLYLNGKWTAGTGSLNVQNPATGEPIGTVATIDRPRVAQALEDAQRAFPAWRSLTAKRRGQYLRAIADEIERRAEEIARLITQENGKPLRESRTEVAGAIDHLQWFAEEGRRAYGRIVPHQTEGKRHLIIKTPVGVVGAISPWNFPLILAVRKVAPALAAGCPVVLKPASATPLCALELAKAVDAAGVPAGVFQLLLGNASAIAGEMLANPICRKISFTGSTQVGRQLIEGAAATVTQLSLELGGHAPALVFEDADLDQAVQGVIDAKFRNTGQSCIAANRVYVQRSIYDAFLEKLRERVDRMQAGNGFEEDSDIGPMISAEALEGALRQIDDVRRQGARVLAGGGRVAGRGHFLQPTVLADVSAGALCMSEEAFAPIAPVAAFDTEQEAVDRANDTVYGLAAYAFTRDVNRIWRLSESLEAGTIGINDAVPSTSNCPFGGIKQSGWNRELGQEGLEAFLETKHVSFGGVTD